MPTQMWVIDGPECLRYLHALMKPVTEAALNVSFFPSILFLTFNSPWSNILGNDYQLPSPFRLAKGFYFFTLDWAPAALSKVMLGPRGAGPPFK